MDPIVPLVIVGGIAIVGGLIALSFVFDRKRTQAFEAAAADMGLQFQKDADSRTTEIRSRFDLFSKGRGRKARNLIYGETNGTGVWIFDYEYTTGSGKHSHTHRQTVISFSSTQLGLPRFNLYREGMMSRIGSSVFGQQDIDFETHPEFSKQFVLQGDSEADIRAAFHPDVLSFLETQDRNLRIEADRELLLVYRASKKVKPAAVKQFLGEGFCVFREFLSG